MVPLFAALAALALLPAHPTPGQRGAPLHIGRAVSPLAALNRKQRRHHLQPSGTPYPTAHPATNLEPTECAGVTEEHAFEQYFFDEATRAALLDLLLARHSRPLLLCAPSLAVEAEARGAPYLLLDRDERFGFLRGFRPFDLERPEPETAADFAFDCVLCDPPFSNFELARLREVLNTLGAAAAPLYLCYNARREGALVDAFAGSGRELVRMAGGPLGYTSVKASTQQHIFLYGPPWPSVGVPS